MVWASSWLRLVWRAVDCLKDPQVQELKEGTRVRGQGAHMEQQGQGEHLVQHLVHPLEGGVRAELWASSRLRPSCDCPQLPSPALGQEDVT